MHILLIGSELAPFTHDGPLGELVGDLSVALAQQGGHKVTVVAPYRDEIDPEQHGLARRLQKVAVTIGGSEEECLLYEGSLRFRDASAWLIDHPATFRREGSSPADRGDDHRTAYLLAAAALQLCTDRGFTPDLIHCVGWQSALLPLLLRNHERLAGVPVVFTVDDPTNTACYPSAILDELGLGYDDFNPDGIEFHGQVSLLKAGLVFSQQLTMLAPGIAERVQLETHGAGLHGLFQWRSKDLHGVLPGLENVIWNARTDRHLAAPFDANEPEGKAINKAALQQHLALAQRATHPLLVCAGPFDSVSLAGQLELLAERLAAHKFQLVLAGPADGDSEAALRRFAAGERERVAIANIGFDDDLWHPLFAGADAVLTASGPAGIWQALRAQRYGAAPIVAEGSGADDLVVDFDLISRSGTGFVYDNNSPTGLRTALQRFLGTADVDTRMAALRTNLLGQEIGWERPIALLEQVYAAATPVD